METCAYCDRPATTEDHVPAQTLLQRLPRLRTGQSGVDNRETLVVDEAIHVDVTESGHPDRQLHAEHAGRNLGDLVRRRFLFLLPRARRGLRLRLRRHEAQGSDISLSPSLRAGIPGPLDARDSGELAAASPSLAA